MYVIYDNYIIDSTLSATNEDGNRPVTNIIHNFLELAFYSTMDSSVINIIFDNDENIDCVAFDYHNIENMEVSFYNVFDVLIGTEIINVNENCNFHVLNTVYENVKRMTITINSVDYFLYVGTIFAGEYIELPRFLQSPDNNLNIRDTTFISPGGQSSGNRRRPIDDHGLQFANLTKENIDDLKLYITYVQNSIPHFIDLYPDVHNEFSPFYGTLTIKKIPYPKRYISDFKFNYKLIYQEVR